MKKSYLMLLLLSLAVTAGSVSAMTNSDSELDKDGGVPIISKLKNPGHGNAILREIARDANLVRWTIFEGLLRGNGGYASDEEGNPQTRMQILGNMQNYLREVGGVAAGYFATRLTDGVMASQFGEEGLAQGDERTSCCWTLLASVIGASLGHNPKHPAAKDYNPNAMPAKSFSKLQKAQVMTAFAAVRALQYLVCKTYSDYNDEDVEEIDNFGNFLLATKQGVLFGVGETTSCLATAGLYKYWAPSKGGGTGPGPTVIGKSSEEGEESDEEFDD